MALNEPTMQITCPYCSSEFEVIPRDSDWNGGFRLHVTCISCAEVFGWKFLPQGPKRMQAPIVACCIADDRKVIIEEYDGTVNEAMRFGFHFQNAWNRIPTLARESVALHWAKSQHSPFIWLLNDRKEWGVEILDVEIWMEQHYVDNKFELRRRERPLMRTLAEQVIRTLREPIHKDLIDFALPERFLKFQANSVRQS